MNDEMELTITVAVRQRNGAGYLNLNNTMMVKAKDFLAMRQILGQFQQLADKFKTNEKK